MKVSVAQSNNVQLSNTKTLKHRNSGIKSVSVKNTPFASPKMKNCQSPRVNANIDLNKYNYRSKLQSGLQKQSQQENQLVLSLLQKCLRPQIPNLKHNSYETDEINSRVILMINKTQSQNLINQPRPKSCGIKIGSKAQKHRQNNKSEPKKVYDLSNLSSQYENSPSQSKKQSSLGQIQNRKQTQRKINTKILMTKKNSPQITEFSSRLKKFQQDLKKTKKPRILTLEFHSTNNNQNFQQNEDKNYMSLKNHPILPKFQHLSCPNIYVSPVFQQKRNRIEMDDIQTVNKEYFPRDKFRNKDISLNLEKTKKIVNFALQNSQNIDQKVAENIQTKFFKQTDMEMFSLDTLLPKEQIQYVLKRFKKDQSKAQEMISESRIDPTVELLNISIPEVSCQNSHQKDSSSHKDQEEFSLLRQMNSANLNYRQSQALRVTDYNKKVKLMHKIESPNSQRRRSVNNFKPRQSFQQQKIRCLNQGAKTIVTKYDSSDKRSIVQESVILFQCSKDLKPSFSRQLLNLNEYAARYRGSLGVQSLINQNQEQYLMGNSKMQGRFFDESQSTFEKILMSPNPNNGKLRKSYSIKEMENNNF